MTAAAPPIPYAVTPRNVAPTYSVGNGVTSPHTHAMETLGLGDYIRRRRDAMGWTQTDLADRAGMNRAVLAQIETGRIKLPFRDHGVTTAHHS